MDFLKLSKSGSRQIVSTLVSRLFVGTFIALSVSSVSAASVWLDPTPYLHAQRLVDIGQRHLNLYCTGTGLPTVILDAPAGATNKVGTAFNLGLHARRASVRTIAPAWGLAIRVRSRATPARS